MANSEHVKRLQEGVEVWNEYCHNARRSEPLFTPDFKEIDLANVIRLSNQLAPWDVIDLSGIDLRGANLVRTGLDLVDLSNANLSNADLRGASFGGSILTNANLSFAQLEDADLRGATLANVAITRSKLWEAKLYSRKEPLGRFLGRLMPLNTVGDTLEQIKRIESYHDARRGEIVLYFRGEAQQYRHPLMPKVMRPPQDHTHGMHESESEMLRDLMSRRPEEFSELKSAFAEWALAQHHGLPTRFLDVTRNPLVALFNACKDAEREIGRLHIFAVPRDMIKPFNSDTVSIIANLAKLKRGEQDILLGKAMKPEKYLLYSGARLRLYQGIKQEKPYFEERINPKDLYRVFVVEPQQFTERVRVQSGAFLVSAFHNYFDPMAIRNWNKCIPMYAYYRLAIPSTCKGDITRELELLNITDETLAPGLDESAKAVEKTFK